MTRKVRISTETFEVNVVVDSRGAFAYADVTLEGKTARIEARGPTTEAALARWEAAVRVRFDY